MKTETYIALLRGINVGGNNMIAMPALRAAFVDYGFTKVSSYINSGNIIFASELANEAEIKALCERLITERFGFTITVNIISVAALAAALAAAPSWWNSSTEAKHNAIFVIPPTTAEEVCAQVGRDKPDDEQVACQGRVIFWTAPLEGFSHSRWAKVVSGAMQSRVTIRNAATTVKLLSLAQAAE